MGFTSQGYCDKLLKNKSQAKKPAPNLGAAFLVRIVDGPGSL
jgi:hypothetical protein